MGTFGEPLGTSWEPLGASFVLSWTLVDDLMKPHGVILATLEPELLRTLKGSSKIKLLGFKREPFITFWPPEHENIYIYVLEPGPGRVNPWLRLPVIPGPLSI